MNKMLVLAKNAETYFIKRLIEEVGMDFLTFFNPWEEAPGQHPHELILVRTTGVYEDDRDLRFLETQKQSKIMNPLYSLEIFRQKKRQYEFFQDHQIGCLPWMDLSAHSLLDVEGAVHSWGSDGLLVKPNRGQGGWGIEAFFKGHLPGWWSQQEKKKDLSYVIQPWIQNAQEFRVFFIQQDFKLTLERIPGPKVVSNFSQGGLARLSSLPFQFESELNKLISLSQAKFGSIDLFLMADKMWVLELNTAPGIEQLEKVSGHNIMREIISRVILPG